MTKLARLRSKMKELSVDALIVLDELNQYYLSEFSFSDGLLFISDTQAYLITDFRYYEMAKLSPTEFEVVMPDSRGEFLGDLIEENGCKRVGFEGASVSYAVYRHYADSYPSVEFVNVGAIIEEQRQIKSPEEIMLISKAQSITDAAFSELLGRIKPDMTELEVAAELEYSMRKNGADGLAFETIAVSGDASALPHGKPRNERLKRGFLTMDFGAKYKGYCSDMTRTVVIGRADAEMSRLYNTVLSAQTKALDFLREGVDLGEADKVARDLIDRDYSGAFGHSLGHSVGLYIHESPNISRRSFGRCARVGEIYTVEPGIYLYGKYGCRIEDMAAIERDGVLNLTHSTKELIEII